MFRKSKEFEDYLRGLIWAKDSHESGIPIATLAAYLVDGSDAFDRGARAYFCGYTVLEV